MLQQNSELQREVFALRQGQEATEKKKEDTVRVGLTYGASLCSRLGFGSTLISTGVSLEGLVGVPMNGSGQLSGVWNGPGQVGGAAAMKGGVMKMEMALHLDVVWARMAGVAEVRGLSAMDKALVTMGVARRA